MIVVLSLVVLLVSAVPALAEMDNGEGLAGETTDRVVTFFSLGVMVFFPLVCLVFTLIESLLERRHEEREHLQARRHRAGA
jgi:hypothetical protein